MACMRSTVFLLLACGLFAEAQIAAPTAKPEETVAVQDNVVSQISAPTEAPKDATRASESSAPTKAPIEHETAPKKATTAPIKEPEASKITVAERELRTARTKEELKRRKVRLCEVKAEVHLEDLDKAKTVKKGAGWVYGPLSGDYDVKDGCAECIDDCRRNLDCEHWVYMCKEDGRGVCRLHGHGGGEEKMEHAYMGESDDFKARYETAETRRQKNIADGKALEAAKIEEALREVEEAEKSAISVAKSELDHVKAKRAKDSSQGGDRRLKTSSHGEDIFGEGEL